MDECSSVFLPNCGDATVDVTYPQMKHGANAVIVGRKFVFTVVTSSASCEGAF